MVTRAPRDTGDQRSWHIYGPPCPPAVTASRLPAYLWAQRSVPPTPSISRPPDRYWTKTLGTLVDTSTAHASRCLPVYRLKSLRINFQWHPTSDCLALLDFWPFLAISGLQTQSVWVIHTVGTLEEANMTIIYNNIQWMVFFHCILLCFCWLVNITPSLSFRTI